MNNRELRRAWAVQAQTDAEKGVLECRICRRREPLDETMSLWRAGDLIFAVCGRCLGSCELVIRPTSEGIEVRARRADPLIVRAT